MTKFAVLEKRNYMEGTYRKRKWVNIKKALNKIKKE